MSAFSSPQGLPALEARLQQDLAWLDLPPKPWLPSTSLDGQPLLPVAIVGAGMAGLTAASALWMQGVPAVLFDQARPGLEGPWATTARMETLRSPKHLTGPCLGLPALTFRAWFEAQWGPSAWNALDKIPRLQWMDYLRWYRQVMPLEVRNQHRMMHLEPLPSLGVRINFSTPNGTQTVLARRVVLALGRDGLGAPWSPAWSAQLPRERWTHSSDEMDYSALRGQRVVVIGGSASAMDSAATALEAGAQRVDLLIRREALPLVNKSKGSGNPGIHQGYPLLSDEWKWRVRRYINSLQTPPPRGSTLRVSRHENAYFHLGAPVQGVEVRPDGVRLITPHGPVDTDFVIFSTGYRVDLARRPELAAIAPHLRTWSLRHAPAPGDEDDELLGMPDLGPGFEMQAIDAQACLGLSRIHAFCYPATLSHGAVAGDIPAISEGAQRLTRALVGSLYQEDIDHHFQALQHYAEPELHGDEWQTHRPLTAHRGNP
jgi:cation diffusion facilitator CzcD-associated flavoprotein CzcO